MGAAPAPGATALAPKLATLVVLVAVLLVALTAAIAANDGVFDRPFDARFWRLRLLGPALLVYWLVAPGLAARSHDRLVVALTRIVLLSERQQLDSLRPESRSAAARLRVPAFVLVGVVIGTVLGRPWTDPIDSLGSVALRWGLNVLVWGLIGAFIVDTLIRARLTDRLHTAPLRLDLFDLSPLVPVARWGLSIVWVIAGAATIAAAAILDASILADYWVPIVTIYIAMTLIAIGLFFSAMWPSHTLIVRLKQHQLADIAQHLVQAHVKLTGDLDGAPQAAVEVAAWVILERRMREVPNWPYNTTILRNLAVTLFVPTAVAVARAYFGVR